MQSLKPKTFTAGKMGKQDIAILENLEKIGTQSYRLMNIVNYRSMFFTIFQKYKNSKKSCSENVSNFLIKTKVH